MNPLRNVWTLLFAALMTGCTVGPDYHRPPVPVPATWKELDGWTAAHPDAAALSKGDWWTAFHDPLLDELEPQVAVSNQTVRQSLANYQEALADVRLARASLFPTLGVTGSGTRERAGTSASTAAFGNRRTVNNAASLEGDISWAPDLWGEVRRSIEQSAATAQASQATLANATLAEQVALAQAVIDLRVADANIDLFQRTVQAYTESLRVTQNQSDAGTIAPSDLITARTQLETAQSSLIALGVSRAKYEHAIAVLVGRNPEALDVAHGAALPALPEIPAGVPSTLLERRPDIAVAERQMAAQNAAIGVAVAAYYPTISLSGLAGLSSSPLAGLFNIASYVWSLGGSASETIFDGGARGARVDAARAAYDSAVANYRGTVLGAFQNVEDDLSGLRILAQQQSAIDLAVQDARHGAQVALNEYQAGTVDYTTVATAQATQLTSEETALGVTETRLIDTAALFGDLGGGWSISELCDARRVSCGGATDKGQ
ncbi:MULTISPECIES: efflux transporter outer membrane subunit [unclassified Caballeronia]|uniref:efflux transporter outer membrane subunit n=1 Tax=unclassified Caballeronia TaxID=2646786 RepID=UPI002858B509|nr:MULTISPECIES: efflux transporter outer membrane subunit [unclassified Caballeronia]MDR5818686.1 efflux transporter outer membrane subunit [Caballeronia sp. LZ033]MDR5822672.1 efflux transporter outer membrane subunit [Caballeronia sp. LZ043]